VFAIWVALPVLNGCVAGPRHCFSLLICCKLHDVFQLGQFWRSSSGLTRFSWFFKPFHPQLEVWFWREAPQKFTIWDSETVWPSQPLVIWTHTHIHTHTHTHTFAKRKVPSCWGAILAIHATFWCSWFKDFLNSANFAQHTPIK
jgi:hypothetical protein